MGEVVVSSEEVIEIMDIEKEIAEKKEGSSSLLKRERKMDPSYSILFSMSCRTGSLPSKSTNPNILLEWIKKGIWKDDQ